MLLCIYAMHNLPDVSFHNIENQKIKDCFLEVLYRYRALHDCRISLSQLPIKSSTMQAQPVLKPASLFKSINHYKVKLSVKVRDSDTLRVAELPTAVLTGWFAHELGHLCDYRSYNNFTMIAFGLKYAFSSRFRREAEHAADRIAIQHGFRQEIIATKKFILNNQLLDEGYKNKIRKYYMPIEMAEVWQHSQSPISSAPDIEL